MSRTPPIGPSRRSWVARPDRRGARATSCGPARQELDGSIPRRGLPSTRSLRLVQAGGKRLRPAFCYWGYRAAGGPTASPRSCAPPPRSSCCTRWRCVHDDLMDGTPERRGVASHAASRPAGGRRGRVRSRRVGVSVAMLAGDLAAVLADQLFLESGLPPERIARRRRRATTGCGWRWRPASCLDVHRRRAATRNGSPRSRVAPTRWRGRCLSARRSPAPRSGVDDALCSATARRSGWRSSSGRPATTAMRAGASMAERSANWSRRAEAALDGNDARRRRRPRRCVSLAELVAAP